MNNELNILVAEDDPAYAHLIKAWINASVLTDNVLHFKNGQEILDYMFDHRSANNLTSSKYIVLLDINMPNVGGIEVLKRIKSDEVLRSIPVIMLTLKFDDDEISLCYNYGCNGYICKSSNLERLWAYLHMIQIPKVCLKQNSPQESNANVKLDNNQPFHVNCCHARPIYEGIYARLGIPTIY